MFRGFTSNPERAVISVTSCLADLGLCSDCQQGGLLQLSPRWYIVPAARPAAVRIECHCPSGFSARPSERVTPLLRELHWLGVPERVTFRLCVLAYRCLHGTAPSYLAASTLAAVCVLQLSHAGRTFYQTYNDRRPCLSSGFCVCMEQFAVIRQVVCAVADVVPS